MQKLNHWIDGQAHPPESGDWLDVFDPATGSAACASRRAAIADDVEAAVVAAAERASRPGPHCATANAPRGWKNSPPRWKRASMNSPAPNRSTAASPSRWRATSEIPRAVSNLRFFAHAATQFASESHHGEAGLNYTLRAPLGVVATISPWNLPLYLFTWKIAPALAAGNTVVAKPSEITPLTATMLGELAAEIGFPAGVLNIVHGLGPEVGEPLVTHPAGPRGFLHRQHCGRQAHRRARRARC